jgi:hypothetical protein
MANSKVTFSENLQRLVTECVDNYERRLLIHADLLQALGCTYRISAPNTNVIYKKPAFPVAANLPVVESAFRAIFNELDASLLTHEDAVALLSGLVRRRIWRSCLGSEAGSYGLVVCVLHYANMYRRQQNMTTGRDKEFIDKLTSVALPILNDWTKPHEPWAVCPSMEHLCRAFFGCAWWDIRQPMIEGTSGAPIIKALLSDRPPFRPGLVKWVSSEALMLPTMGN